jgi:16S rRNA (guanine966-N2)-methyltransferase
VRIIAGRWGGRRIRGPRGRGIRPTADRVREAWMSALQDALPGAVVLDVFAGSGALGLEALSRGARQVTFVEKSPASLEILRANIRALRATDAARVVRANAIDFVRGLSAGSYDLALADPPYDRGLAGRLAEAFLESPFAAELWIEHSRREALPTTPDVRTRRYGDTLLTTLTRDHA